MPKNTRSARLLVAFLVLLTSLRAIGEEEKQPVSSRRTKRPILETDKGSPTPAHKPTIIGKKAGNSTIQIRTKSSDRPSARLNSDSQTTRNGKTARRDSSAQRLRSAKNSIVYREILDHKSQPVPQQSQPLLQRPANLIQNNSRLNLDTQAQSQESDAVTEAVASPSDGLNTTEDGLNTTEDALNIPGDESLTPVAESFQPSSELAAQDNLELLEPIESDVSDTDQEDPSILQAHRLHSNSESNRMRLSPIEERPKVISPNLDEPTGPSNEDSNVMDEPHASSSDLLFETQIPVISVRTRGPRTLVVGKAASYTIDLVNSSDHGAKDVVINVRIPTWTELKNQQPSVGIARIQPDDRGNTVMQWSVGRLNGNSKQKLTLDIIPRSSRPFEFDVTSTFNPLRSMAQIQVQEPKLELSVVGPSEIPFGTTKVYTISVSNPGTGDADNVVLQLLPLIPTDGNIGVRELGVLKAGTRRTIEVELTAKQTGRLQVRAEVTGDGGLVARNHHDVIVRRAALDVQVQAPLMKYAGTPAQFVISVTNSGDAIARDVVAVATLPAGVTQVEANGNGTVHDTHGQVQWELGTLRPGDVRRMQVEGVLTKAGANRIDIRTVAKGSLNAVKSAVTTVESLADLKLAVNDPKGAIAVGSDVIYEVRVMNRGTKEAKNISLVGYFSEGIEPLAVSGWAGKTSEGQVDLDTIKQLGPGQEMLLKITAKANRQGNHVFRAELTCNNPETRLASEEWTRFYGENSMRQAQTSRTRGTSRPLQRAK